MTKCVCNEKCVELLFIQDVLTDLNAEGEPLPTNPPHEDWLGHKVSPFAVPFFFLCVCAPKKRAAVVTRDFDAWRS